jgi:hypothetical protein
MTAHCQWIATGPEISKSVSETKLGAYVSFDLSGRVLEVFEVTESLDIVGVKMDGTEVMTACNLNNVEEGSTRIRKEIARYNLLRN